MGRIIEIPYSENIIEFVASKLLEEERNDFSSVTVVFPHKRPAFYLRRILSSRIGHSFLPPRILSMDEFMSTLAAETAPGLHEIDNLESAYLLLQIVSKISGSPWQKSSTSFSEFLPWGLKIEQVIGELDIELIKDAKLKKIGIAEDWGQDVSKNTQHLLGCLGEIRQAFHAMLEKYKLTTRSLDYARAAGIIAEGNTVEFPTIYFVGIFAMTEAEKRVIRHFLSASPQAYLLRQNDGSSWKPFEETDGWAEKETIAETSSPEIFLHSAFNIHSEVVGLRNTMKKEVDYEKAAIILPDPATLIPLLSEVMTSLDTDYNITMGYPLTRTPLYTLLDLIMSLEETRHEDSYSAEDYLSLLMHPYIKNFGCVIEPIHMRILTHSVEESLLRGKPFIKLSEIENQNEIFERAAQMTGREVPLQEFRDGIGNIHEIFIRKMSQVKTLSHLGEVLEEILGCLLRHSPAAHYPFSGEFFHSFFLLSDKLRNFLLKYEEFKEPGELFGLFRHLTGEMNISFQGIPLKGLQVLGLLEARCLNFKQVFILDCNEGVFSSAAPEDSLLPLASRAALGLPLHYQKEEIYCYHFHSLISSAREAHIFYRETEKELRSHFIEKLVWEMEKNAGEIGVITPEPVALNALPRSSSLHLEISKTREMLDVLGGMNFSPASLNSYLWCPASFYFANVLRLKERDKASSELDATLIGTILHKALEKLYRPFVGVILGKTEYARFEKNLTTSLSSVFHEAFGELQGEHYLLNQMALSRLKRCILLEKQKFLKGGSIVSVEENFSCSLKLKNDITVDITGRADRVDRYRKERMIVDYKSGKNLLRHSFRAFDFCGRSRSEMKKKIKSIQLPLYVFLYHRVHLVPYEDINSRLISLRTGEEQVFFNREVDRQKFMEGVFLPALDSLIQEIFNPEIPFTRDDTDEKTCEYCPFLTFCRKNP